MPFARLDSILLLAKNHLKGKIPDMLNAKDNQVFLDYLAGGQNRRIAVERAANAQSTGVLSMGARNVCGVEDTTTDAPVPAIVITEDQLALIKETRQELEAVKSLMSEMSQMQGLSETFQGVKQVLSELADVKMTCAKKEQEQKLHFAEEIQEQKLRFDEQIQTFEVKKLEDFQAFDVKKRKQNLELDEEEAIVAERCKAIREGRRMQLQGADNPTSLSQRGSDKDEEGPVNAEDNTNEETIIDYRSLVYNESAEAGMDEEVVQQRRRLWKQLVIILKEEHRACIALAQELNAFNPAMAEFDAQCMERFQKYTDLKVGCEMRISLLLHPKPVFHCDFYYNMCDLTLPCILAGAGTRIRQHSTQGISEQGW